MSNQTYIGYSNGVAYDLITANLNDNTGLIQLSEWIFPVWCKFDKIEQKQNER